MEGSNTDNTQVNQRAACAEKKKMEKTCLTDCKPLNPIALCFLTLLILLFNWYYDYIIILIFMPQTCHVVSPLLQFGFLIP